ncbi:MAG: glutathione S-transferase [Rhodobacteraceae bacterium]|nr:glutathione S-transferase [Paracoccaceae bacterium]
MTSTTTEPRYRLWQNPGWGSAIVEAQLAAYGLPYDLVTAGDIYHDAAARAALMRVNPSAQVPTLELPSGEAMGESAAMTLYLAEVTGRDDLVPAPGDAPRPAFLRWLVFMVSSIYPAGHFADAAERLVPEAEVAGYRAKVVAERGQLWRMLAEEAARRGGPWVLGDRFTALDIYVAVMTRWQPGRAWFAAELPALVRIAEAVAARPELRAVFDRNAR